MCPFEYNKCILKEYRKSGRGVQGALTGTMKKQYVFWQNTHSLEINEFSGTNKLHYIVVVSILFRAEKMTSTGNSTSPIGG